MHPLGQIFSTTEFVRNFSSIVRHLGRAPQHLLVTHKSGKRFVFVNAEPFDELLDYRLSEGGTISRPPSLRKIVLGRLLRRTQILR